MSQIPQSHDTSLGAARGFYNCPETPDPVSLSVTGKLPEWLEGVLYRTGPGTFSIPTNKPGEKPLEIRHWFDGLTLHHRFEIKNGQVIYRSKNGASAMEEYIKRTGKFPSGGSFGQADPCESILGRFFVKFKQSLKAEPRLQGPTSQNVGVTFTPHFNGFSADGPGDLVAKSDYFAVQILDRVTLEPLGIRSYSTILPELDGPLSAAHAGIGDNGEFYNFTLNFGPKPTYKVFKIDAAGKPMILAEISDAPAAYLHSIFLTKRFVVLVVWQSDFKLNGLPIALYDAVSVNTFKEWSDTRKTLFYVIDRENGGVVGRYQTDPFFAFHSINSFDDEDGSVVLDIGCFPDNQILNLLRLETVRNLGTNPEYHPSLTASARRFRLENIKFPVQDPSNVSKSFLEAKVDFNLGPSANIELPTVAPSVSNKAYRFAYGIHWEPDSDPNVNAGFVNSIIKIDVKTEKSVLWKDKNPMVPGEPIFVPRPPTSGEEFGEDAGVLLTVALDATKGTSALVVLDAETMLEVARAEMAIPFPFGFHGAFTTK